MTFEGFIKYPAVFATGLAAALLLTPWIMRLATRAGMVDQPDARRIHRRPVPRGGGLAVFAGFHAACAVAFFWPWGTFATGMGISWWARYALLSGLLTLLGLADDRFGVKPWVKLGGQALVAVLAYVMGMRFGLLSGIELPPYADLPITVFWILALVNAFNLIDGMDGLASGLGAIAALGLAGSFLISGTPGDCLVMLGLAGACLGFLRYNFHPARVFLGDTGSMFIGFTLAAVSLSTSTKSTAAAAVAVPLLAVGVPMFDTFLAVWRRSARRLLGRLSEADAAAPGAGKVFHADLDHLHHRLLRSGLSQGRAAGLLYVVAALLVGVGLAAMARRSLAAGLYVVTFVAASYVAVRHVVHVELWDSAAALAKGLEKPPRKALVVPLYLLADGLILIASLALALAAGLRPFSWWELRAALFDHGAYYVGVPFILLMASGTYRRVWSRARTVDFLYLSASAGAGLALGSGLYLMANGSDGTDGEWLKALMMAALCLPGLAGIRLFKRAVQDAFADMGRWQRRQPDLPGALVYGADDAGVLFLRQEASRARDGGRACRVVGFLDDDLNLRGRRLHGYPVFGGMESIEDVVAKTGASTIVICADLDADAASALSRLAAERGLKMLRWKTVLEPC